MDDKYKSRCTKYTMYSIRTYMLQELQKQNVRVRENLRSHINHSFIIKNKPTMAHRNLEKVIQWMSSELELELCFLNSKACKLLWQQKCVLFFSLNPQHCSRSGSDPSQNLTQSWHQTNSSFGTKTTYDNLKIFEVNYFYLNIFSL